MRLQVFIYIICVIALSSTVHAQTQTSNKEPPAVANITQKQFGDWSYRCARPYGKTSGAATCELAQSVRIERDGKLIEVVNLAVSRAKDKAGKVAWALVAVTPLDVHLPSKFGVSVGKTTVTTAPYRNCNRLGCWAVVPLEASILKQFEAQKEAAALFRVLDGKTVRIVFSLKGFTKGFRALKGGKVPK